jgi:hypothetical protein
MSVANTETKTPGAPGGGVPMSQFDAHLAAEMEKPGCWTGVFVPSTLGATDSLPSFPAGSDFGDAAKTAAQTAAIHRIVAKGLGPTLRSPIVRRFLALGEDASVAIPLSLALYSVGKGVFDEVKAMRAGTCQGF